MGLNRSDVKYISKIKKNNIHISIQDWTKRRLINKLI